MVRPFRLMPTPPSERAPERPYVLDASRLVWRLWRRRLPTGIDRVCLAYAEAFAGRALALLQWRNRRVVLSAQDSDALFALLLEGAAGLRRRRLVALLVGAIPRAVRHRAVLAGKICLNVGHTGLNEPTLPAWLAQARLRPVHLVHDLIPITHPAYCRAGEALRHAERMSNALRSARGIVVNSAETGVQLERFAQSQGLPMPPLLVAHLGIEGLASESGTNPHPRPYFLSIGTIEARKNHALLLRAWAALRDELGADTPDLVLVGQRGWEAQDTFALLDAHPAQHGRIIELGRCDDGELAGWIDHARAVLMPSHVEGYGLPVLEALARGTPVIASDLPVYREIAAGIPLLVDPDNEAAWRTAIRDHLAAGRDHQRQRRALADYTPPRWSDHFAQVQNWLGKLPA